MNERKTELHEASRVLICVLVYHSFLWGHGFVATHTHKSLSLSRCRAPVIFAVGCKLSARVSFGGRSLNKTRIIGAKPSLHAAQSPLSTLVEMKELPLADLA